MADTDKKTPAADAWIHFIGSQAAALAKPWEAPRSPERWERRRKQLLAAMMEAVGPFPSQACPLSPKILADLARPRYRIETLIFQSRPDVWVTANAYVPTTSMAKFPAVLVVHGHWPLARRDPVVQARCLGLASLGFFVLAVDAFGAGERFPEPGPGTYHGALFGSTLWPVGQTLLGMQVYDNQRAVDYLLTRPEVDGSRMGITGASGGGNQSMYAGALDPRLKAVVPVCSVGNYPAYLRAACCVCEVLPGALRFIEEGEVLGLVAPRALLVINASQDSIQFSPKEAEKSLAMAAAVYPLYGARDRLRHSVFDSTHGYNQAMREAMYGWMTRWLKNEGTGRPIAERAVQQETPESLSCWARAKRPASFLFPPSWAAIEGRRLVAKLTQMIPDHPEEWESTAVHLRKQLRVDILGDFPRAPRPVARPGKVIVRDGVSSLPVTLQTEAPLAMPVLVQNKNLGQGTQRVCILLHLDGMAAAINHPLAHVLISQGWSVVTPDLRATGTTKPLHDRIGNAQDHNSAEHAVWLGRPLLGQWAFDVQCLLDWLALQPGLDKRRLAIVGIGAAGVLALTAAGLFDDRVAIAAAVDMPVTLITESAYGPRMRMGLLAPGFLKVGDIPQLAALSAPRRLVVIGGTSPQDKNLREQALRDAFGFTARIYGLYKAGNRLTIREEAGIDEWAGLLA